MLKYIIRLDDACPTMNKEKWDKMEKLLDKYNIKPIVGIIPDNKDPEFNNEFISSFWEKYPLTWQKKDWIIAQHGLNHNLSKEVRTEFKNVEYEEQLNILRKGQAILKEKNVNTSCFFAPAHTFDDNTIKACVDLGCFDFISDGYAFYPYEYKNMMFLPSVFDTPHKISMFGVFTFVYHPNKMENSDFEYLEEFIKKYKTEFNVDIIEVIKKYKGRKKNIFDYILTLAINIFRKLRNIVKENNNE